MIKKFFKKIIFKILKLKIDKNILMLSRKILFLNLVFISNKKEKIYLIKTKKSFVIDLDTVKTLTNYNLYLDFSFYAIQIPLNSIENHGNLDFYFEYMKKPVEEGLILFESFFGKSYAGQPKYIYEYLLNNGIKYKFIWVYQGNHPNIPGDVTIVKRGSKEYFKVLATAQYWVNNIVFPVNEKRKETTYIQTWHGTPLKRLGYDIEVAGPEVEAREKFYKQSRTWDYLLTQNRYTSEILKRAFKFDKEIVECGYPHNDFLVNNDIEVKNCIKQSLGIEKNKKVILYAPTWRDNDSNGNWSFNFSLKMDLVKWQEVLGNEYVVLIRMHHLITNIKDLDELEGFAFNVSKYDDIQELSLISDILITDYSSVFFDFAVSKKPILFFTYDYKEYAEKLRGFYLDMNEDMPGPMLSNDKSLLDAIIGIDKIEKDYKDKYKKFLEKFCYLDTGFSSQQVVDRIFKGKDA